MRKMRRLRTLLHVRKRRINDLIKGLLKDSESYNGRVSEDLSRLWTQYLRPYRLSLISILLLTLLWSTHGYIFALLSRFLVDDILFVGADASRFPAELIMQRFYRYLLFLAATWTMVVLTQWLRSRLVLDIGQRIVYLFRKQLHEKLQRLHVGFFETTETGKIMSRVLEDVWVIRQWTTAQSLNLLSSVLQLLIGLVVIFFLNWKLSLLITAALPLYWWTFIKMRPVIRTLSIASRRLNANMYALSAERIGGISVVKAFGREEAERASFTKRMHNFVRLAVRIVFYQRLMILIAGVITAVVSGLIIYIGMLQVKSGNLSTGDVMVFVFALPRIFNQVNVLAGIYVTIQAAFVVLKRVFNLLDEPEEVQPGNIQLDGMEGKIEFDHVFFRYPGQNRWALQDLSLTIKPGTKVALMGPSGAGKTTVFQLVCRFYDAEQGVIRIGGVNLPDADPRSLRRHAVMVQQEPVVFSGTIGENIMYGRLDALPQQIMDAAEQAELHDFIMSLPVKYETEVGQNGISLSGGQKQRLALATALLTKPEILLLDDTTSALDAETEAKIRETLNRVLSGRTSIIITQRIATARDCDMILVLEEGRLTQAGSHEQLKKIEGFYRNIFLQQESL